MSVDVAATGSTESVGVIENDNDNSFEEEKERRRAEGFWFVRERPVEDGSDQPLQEESVDSTTTQPQPQQNDEVITFEEERERRRAAGFWFVRERPRDAASMEDVNHRARNHEQRNREFSTRRNGQYQRNGESRRSTEFPDNRRERSRERNDSSTWGSAAAWGPGTPATDSPSPSVIHVNRAFLPGGDRNGSGSTSTQSPGRPSDRPTSRIYVNPAFQGNGGGDRQRARPGANPRWQAQEDPNRRQGYRRHIPDDDDF